MADILTGATAPYRAEAVVVTIPADRIFDWPSFHAIFQTSLGFPEFYGNNMDAWIDCMSCIDQPTACLSSVTISAGGLLALRIDDASSFRERCPAQYQALLECTAFVNQRRLSVGDPPTIALFLSGSS